MIDYLIMDRMVSLIFRVLSSLAIIISFYFCSVCSLCHFDHFFLQGYIHFPDQSEVSSL